MKLACFTVFGSDPDDIYYRGALKNALWYLNYWPDWKCRFYLGGTPLRQGLGALLEPFPNAEVVPMPHSSENQSATFWRFLALREKGHEALVFRDVDSRPIERERLAVQQWLDSDRDFHVIRDHRRHGVPMLAGLWGVKGPGLDRIRHRVPQYLAGAHYQVDQQWLSSIVWGHARLSLMQHVSNGHDFDLPSEPFVVSYAEGFCGEGLNGDDSPRFPLHRLEG